MTNRHLLFNIALPALVLIALSVALGMTSRVLLQMTEKPTEEQLQDMAKKIERNEVSLERLKAIAVDIPRSDKAVHQTLSELLRVIALATVFFTGWLAFGSYRLLKKAQQGVPADVVVDPK